MPPSATDIKKTIVATISINVTITSTAIIINITIISKHFRTFCLFRIAQMFPDESSDDDLFLFCVSDPFREVGVCIDARDKAGPNMVRCTKVWMRTTFVKYCYSRARICQFGSKCWRPQWWFEHGRGDRMTQVVDMANCWMHEISQIQEHVLENNEEQFMDVLVPQVRLMRRSMSP